VNSPVQTTTLTKLEVWALEAAVEELQELFNSELVVLGFIDQERRLFLHYRPGSEINVARTLRGIDWKRAVRLAEEHHSL
jgi:hypothetical protein